MNSKKSRKVEKSDENNACRTSSRVRGAASQFDGYFRSLNPHKGQTAHPVLIPMNIR
jgi:hypothetical protein